jgi:ubiquinone/menaquinone biosynthesis C-methylase UbiE
VAFDDLFSTQARAYAAFRPRYPEALYEWLASIVAARSRALDCGAGSGQAAIALAQHFDEVIAVEPSAAQLANAEQHPRVRYVQAPAESTGIEQGTVDLVTCANAIHWFDLDRFYDEVRRVATQGGVIAAWCYQRSAIEPTIDELLWRYASALDAIKKVGAKDRARIRDAIAATKDYDGVLGKWSFDKNGDTDLTEMTGLQVKNGKFDVDGSIILRAPA